MPSDVFISLTYMCQGSTTRLPKAIPNQGFKALGVAWHAIQSDKKRRVGYFATFLNLVDYFSGFDFRQRRVSPQRAHRIDTKLVRSAVNAPRLLKAAWQLALHSFAKRRGGSRICVRSMSWGASRSQTREVSSFRPSRLKFHKPLSLKVPAPRRPLETRTVDIENRHP